MESTKESNLLFAIVQAQDADIAQHSLKKISIDSYQMPSVGGFLGRKNITLVIDCPENRSEDVIDILQNSCSQRIEFINIPIENAQQAIPTPTQVAVGGAAVFELTAEKVIKL
ncbi:MAG: cyclic-di-AMP receptor [Anaerolineaceae bacterium]|nr:cyclic-di-AMP receptor [Anaerolineaceae bacterium]